MKVFHNIFPLLLILLWSQNLVAENVTGKKPLNQPIKYQMPAANDDLKPDLAKVDESERMNIPWEVYSDRDDNQTYLTSKPEKAFQKIHYLDNFFVYEEEGDYIHIIKDDNFNKTVFSESAEDYGWVNKSQMLLWSHDLVTMKGKINRKAMILNTVEHLKGKNENDSPDIVKFRKGPQVNAHLTGEESQLFQFFYIYKISEDGQSVLLGKNSFFGPTTVRKVMKGWVPRSRAIFWFNRLAVEPNWEEEAVEQRKNGRKVTFFAHKPEAKIYRNDMEFNQDEVIWNNDPLSTTRLIGEWRRFPVLRADEKQKEIITTGVMGDIYTKEGKLLAEENQKIAEMKRKIDSQIAHKRNIKIVFVVDGTKSMAGVFKAVSGAVKSSAEKLNLEYRGKYGENSIDFAGVIYRDYSEGRARQVRTLGFNSTQSFEDFFDPAEARDLNNNTYYESMYLGLETALRSLGLDKDQTNVVILIGDAGNHYPDQKGRTANEIAALMAEKYCHFIAIQAHNSSLSKAYDAFIKQNKVIAYSAATQYRKILAEKYQDLYDLGDLAWKEEDNKFNLTQSPLGAKVIGLSANTQMNQEEIQTEIEQFIKGVDTSNDSLIAKLNGIVDGKGFENKGNAADIKSNEQKANDFYTLPFAEGIWAVFQQSGLSLEELETLKVDKYQVYTPGYTSFKVAGQTEPMLKRVLLMDATELGDLERCLRKLRSATSGSQRREALYETWLEILKEYLGETQNEDALKNLSMEQINRKLWELPGTNSMIGEIKLKDIHNEATFTDRELNIYITKILEKHGRIQNIFFSHNYRYGFRSNERPYYWIDENLLP
ncbi:MAG: type VI secretion system protein TssR domain-containing protein [Fidelibacterota bacterium]